MISEQAQWTLNLIKWIGGGNLSFIDMIKDENIIEGIITYLDKQVPYNNIIKKQKKEIENLKKQLSIKKKQSSIKSKQPFIEKKQSSTKKVKQIFNKYTFDEKMNIIIKYETLINGDKAKYIKDLNITANHIYQWKTFFKKQNILIKKTKNNLNKKVPNLKKVPEIITVVKPKNKISNKRPIVNPDLTILQNNLSEKSSIKKRKVYSTEDKLKIIKDLESLSKEDQQIYLKKHNINKNNIPGWKKKYKTFKKSSKEKSSKEKSLKEEPSKEEPSKEESLKEIKPKKTIFGKKSFEKKSSVKKISEKVKEPSITKPKPSSTKETSKPLTTIVQKTKYKREKNKPIVFPKKPIIPYTIKKPSALNKVSTISNDNKLVLLGNYISSVNKKIFLESEKINIQQITLWKQQYKDGILQRKNLNINKDGILFIMGLISGVTYRKKHKDLDKLKYNLAVLTFVWRAIIYIARDEKEKAIFLLSSKDFKTICNMDINWQIIKEKYKNHTLDVISSDVINSIIPQLQKYCSFVSNKKLKIIATSQKLSHKDLTYALLIQGIRIIYLFNMRKDKIEEIDILKYAKVAINNHANYILEWEMSRSRNKFIPINNIPKKCDICNTPFIQLSKITFYCPNCKINKYLEFAHNTYSISEVKDNKSIENVVGIEEDSTNLIMFNQINDRLNPEEQKAFKDIISGIKFKTACKNINQEIFLSKIAIDKDDVYKFKNILKIKK